MSYSIGVVTLPTAPSRASKRNPAKVETFEIDGDLPILIIPGHSAEELTLEGFLAGTKSTIETNYLSPLEALKGKEVTVAFPDSRYDGTWILADFTYTELDAKRFTYKIKLLKGSDHIIL
jgi:hypothetical protein